MQYRQHISLKKTAFISIFKAERMDLNRDQLLHTDQSGPILFYSEYRQ